MIKRAMKKIKSLAFVSAALSLISCAPVALLNTITPSGHFEVVKDIPYGDHDRMTLDVYTPETPRKNAPLIMFVHGGGWNSGDKKLYKFIGDTFTSEGYTVAMPNYRLHPGITFPDPVTDTAKAVAWAARAYRDRSIILIGHSAGGYNVLMTGFNPSYLRSEGEKVCDRISGIISLAGPTGTIPLTEEPYISIFPDRFTGKDAPLGLTDTPVPPLFLINGANDKTVYPQNAEMLGKKVTQRGGKAIVRIYPGMNHTDPVKVLSRYFDGDASLKTDLLDFIRNVPKQGNYCH